MPEKLILIVEDNPDDELLTLRALKKTQMMMQIVVVRDGAEALDFLFGEGIYQDRVVSRVPDLILLDLNLPKVDGVGVLQRIRSDDRTKHTPVVILTTSDQASDLARTYAHHANSYIRKPTNFQVFTNVISQISAYWLTLNLPSVDYKDCTTSYE